MEDTPVRSSAGDISLERKNTASGASDRLIMAEFQLARSSEDTDSSDRIADVIATLSGNDAAKMWSVLIQLRPHLAD